MNIPALELTAFLEEYGSLAFTDQKVLRADHFYCREERKWLTVYLTQKDGQQFVTDAADQVLCGYHRIAPLFVHSPAKLSPGVQDLLEQLGCLRSRLQPAEYENAKTTLETLGIPSHPFAPAYLVVQAGSLGVVAPTGQVIVPAEYSSIEPFSFIKPGDAGLFLCRRVGHQLNSMDVFDLRGNCIFRQISNLLPREETLLSPPLSSPPVRKIKSLWVIRQTVDRPFPEDPDFQLVKNEPRRYTLKELHRPGSDALRLTAVAEQPVWHYCPPEVTPPTEVLMPLAAVIGQSINCAAEEILCRLPDYRAFRRDQTPLSLRLANVTVDTPLDKLGLSIRAHHCLVRKGLETAGDLLELSEEALPGLHRSNDEIIREITLFRRTLAELLDQQHRP